MLNIIMLNVIMLTVIMLNVIMLTVIMLTVNYRRKELYGVGPCETDFSSF
jgi:hypothetical protein